MTTRNLSRRLASVAACGAALASLGMAGSAHATATIVVNNINAANIGFNDPTPAAPLSTNPGTTLGQQRLFAFTYAANLWGATLTSNQPIVINAQMTALACTATGATLGSAGATSTFRNFANAPFTNTLYSYALANKLSGTYLGTANAAQISANFSSVIGLSANCLPGRTFYLGTDHQHGTNIDFIAVLLHEMGHGLGFQTFTNGQSGAQSGGFPSIWDQYLLGTVTNKLWKDMTNAERAASSISLDKLVWTGARVTAAVPSVLTYGLGSATFSGPAAGTLAGTVRVGEADFGTPLGSAAITGEVMPVIEQTAGAGEACEPLSASNTTAVRGKIAFINLGGTCNAAIKVRNAQDAGAIAVLIGDNVAETAAQPIPLGGVDPVVTIIASRLFLSDATKLTAALQNRSRGKSGVSVVMGRNGGAQYQGADPLGRALLYTPNPFISGSSVSHFDRTMFRNQLMEPNISNDLGSSVIPPEDMTYLLLQDIGW